jgi:hypothetical protein
MTGSNSRIVAFPTDYPVKTAFFTIVENDRFEPWIQWKDSQGNEGQYRAGRFSTLASAEAFAKAEVRRATR